MIPIKIDDKNIAFRDLHLRKIERKIRARIICNKKKYIKEDFEYKVLDWIDIRLSDILIGNLLRNVIKEFNNFILIDAKDIQLTKEHYTEYCTQSSLEEISKNNGIRKLKGIGTTKSKWVDLIFENQNLINELIINNIKIKIKLEEINSVLKDIFINFYENQWDKIKEYDRYTFVTKHNLKTCPYCNMNYILISKRDKKKKNGLRPEIDHFFPKATYPYLAMSFYNLIPSCQVCNHTKSNKDTFEDKLLNPYEIDSSTFKLTYTPKNMNFLQIKERKYNFDSFDIKFKKIDKHSNRYFKLDKLYEQHKDVVLEVLIKRTIYTKSYIEELKRNFHFTDDEIYRFLFCNYKESDEFDKRPLSKLIKDITDELGFVRVGIR